MKHWGILNSSGMFWTIFTLQAELLNSDLLLRYRFLVCLTVYVIFFRYGQHQIPVWTRQCQKWTTCTTEQLTRCHIQPPRHVKVNLEVTEVHVYSFILMSSFALEVNWWAGDNEDEEKRTSFLINGFLWSNGCFFCLGVCEYRVRVRCEGIVTWRPL